MLKTTHNAGFFSCCSVKLNDIVDFVNANKKTPDVVDSSQQFQLYKTKGNRNDVTFDFFEHYDNVKNVTITSPIDYHNTHQFRDYSKLDYAHLAPLIKKYFSPSALIQTMVCSILAKYKLDLNNTLAVYYRGTDKHTETNLASFEQFYDQILRVIKTNESLNILIQTDSAHFLDYINSKHLKNVIVINENQTSYSTKGIHHENLRNDSNYKHILVFLSTVIIMSKCKYIICGSGNCSIWAMLFRGHSHNVIQYLNGTWFANVSKLNN
jgi:hypothetical protein